jgi:hypothetical protein
MRRIDRRGKTKKKDSESRKMKSKIERRMEM